MFSKTILHSPESPGARRTGPAAELSLETIDFSGPSLVSLLARRHGAQDFSSIFSVTSVSV